jgi:hypothetical protein
LCYHTNQPDRNGHLQKIRGSYERENIIYFNAGRDDQVFIVSVHDHKVILEVMKGSSLLIKKELHGFSEDAHFYLVDSYVIPTRIEINDIFPFI